MAKSVRQAIHQRIRRIVSACKRDKKKSDVRPVQPLELLHLYEPVLIDTPNPIEHELYFRAVDRSTAEEVLRDRVDGSCLVRPYKEDSDSIKYVVSIYANRNFFHLFIRQTNDLYAIGKWKENEKLFDDPAGIINHYRLHKLVCTNNFVSMKFFLVPIS